MSDDRNINNTGEGLDDQQRLAQDAVRSLPRPVAGAEFRARLKQQFVEGTIPETPLRDAAPDSDMPRALRPETQRLGRLWLGWTALAAVAVFAVAVLGFNRLPGPQLVATNGAGIVTVAGKQYDATDTGGIEGALRSGARVVVGEGARIDIVYPGSFVLRATEGTDMIMPDRPGRWFRRTVEAPMEAGELSVRTGPQLAGGSLVVRTPDSQTVIHGTLVSILKNEALTCICLYEGDAEVHCSSGNLGSVPPGQRWVVYSDGSKPQRKEIVPEHQDHMLGLDHACANIFDVPAAH